MVRYDRSSCAISFVRIFIFYNEAYETAETRVTQHDIKDQNFKILFYFCSAAAQLGPRSPHCWGL